MEVYGCKICSSSPRGNPYFKPRLITGNHELVSKRQAYLIVQRTLADDFLGQ